MKQQPIMKMKDTYFHSIYKDIEESLNYKLITGTIFRNMSNLKKAKNYTETLPILPQCRLKSVEDKLHNANILIDNMINYRKHSYAYLVHKTLAHNLHNSTRIKFLDFIGPNLLDEIKQLPNYKTHKLYFMYCIYEQTILKSVETFNDMFSKDNHPLVGQNKSLRNEHPSMFRSVDGRPSSTTTIREKTSREIDAADRNEPSLSNAVNNLLVLLPGINPELVSFWNGFENPPYQSQPTTSAFGRFFGLS